MSFEELSQIDDFVNWNNIEEILPKADETAYAPLSADGGLPKGFVHLRLSPEPCAGTEKAYLAVNLKGEKLLVRTKPVKYYNSVRETAIFTDRIVTIGGVLTAEPREVGACCDDTLVYSVYRWIDGVNLHSSLEKLPTPEKFRCGVKAGKLLKRLHSVAAERPRADEKAPLRKAEALLKSFLDSGKAFKGSEAAVGAVEAELAKAERSLLADRPYTALHGDFHAERLFAAASGELGLKPLHKGRYGDPAEDFAAIFKNSHPAFMRGQLKGYFPDGVPGDFFGLMFVYSAMYAMKAAMGGETALAEKISASYDGFSLKIPSWY